MSQNNSDPILFAVMGAIFGSHLLWSGWRRFRRSREIADSAISCIATAAQGTVELQGHGWPSSPLRSPISGEPCVFYHLIVEEEHNNGKHREWVKVAEEKAESPFFIVDSTGTAVVHLEKSETELKWQTSPWGDLGEAEQGIVREIAAKKNPSHELGKAALIFSVPVRVRESVIPVGSPICVYGYFESKMHGTGGLIRPAIGLRSFMEQVLKLSPSEAAELPTTVGMAQKAASGGGGPVIVPAQQTRAIAINPWEAVHGEIHELPDEPLFISDCWRAELLGRISHWNFLRILAGAALLAAAAVIAHLRATGKIHPL